MENLLFYLSYAGLGIGVFVGIVSIVVCYYYFLAFLFMNFNFKKLLYVCLSVTLCWVGIQITLRSNSYIDNYKLKNLKYEQVKEFQVVKETKGDYEFDGSAEGCGMTLVGSYEVYCVYAVTKQNNCHKLGESADSLTAIKLFKKDSVPTFHGKLFKIKKSRN